MVKREKKKKLHGSVLLTVVIVMSLLIVFLFGTLALATAANNRAHVNYSSAQTRVTSRLVAESALKAVNKDRDYARYIGKIGSEMDDVKASVLIQGAGSEDDKINANAMGNISDVLIKKVGTSEYYDTGKNQWLNRDVLQFTANVTLGGVTSTSSIYVLKHYKTDTDGGSGGGAGFITTGNAEFNCKTSLLGGSYVNLPTRPEAEYFDSLGYYYEKRDKYITFNSKSVHLENNGSVIEADAYIYSNVDVQDFSGFVFPKDGAGITIWGDLSFNADNAKGHFGNTFSSAVSTNEVKFNEIPYLFVDGTINGTSAIKLAETTKVNENMNPLENPIHPFNIFCGSIDASKVGNLDAIQIGGDLYCMNPYATSYLGSESGKNFGQSQYPKLYNWTSSVINKALNGDNDPKAHAANSVYSKGNLVLQYMKIDGDVRVEGDCTIKEGVTIGGDLVVGGSLVMEATPNVAGNIITSSVADSDYVEVETVYHIEPEAGRDYDEIPNLKYRYYKYNLSTAPTTSLDHGNGWIEPGVVADPWGNPLKHENGNGIHSYDNLVVYYEWKSDFNPYESISTISVPVDRKIAGEYDLANYLDTLSGSDVADYLNPNAILVNGWDLGGFNDKYYVETYINESGDAMIGANGSPYADSPIYDADGKMTNVGYYSKSVRTDSPVTYYYADTHEIVQPYRTFKDASGNDTGKRSYPQNALKVWFNTETGEQATEEELASSLVSAKEKYGQNIYPAYAEKRVLLGIDCIYSGTGDIYPKDKNDEENGKIDKSDTKIIKTLKEVLDGPTDPYKYDIDLSSGRLPSEISNLYTDELKDSDYLKSASEIRAKMTEAKEGEKVTYLKSYIDNPTDYAATRINIQTTDNKDESLDKTQPTVVYINKSCKLDFSPNADECKHIVFDPGDKEILIIVKNLSLGSGGEMIVNDAGKGTVHFIVENGGEMNISHESIGGIEVSLSTANYYNFIKEYGSSAVSYNCTDSLTYPADKEPKEMKDLFPNGRIKPNVNIYGENGSKFNHGNFFYMTANIKSPNLVVNIGACSGTLKFDSFYYNNWNVTSTTQPLPCWVFGCLNAKEVTSANELNVVFVTDDNDGAKKTPDANEEFWYKTLYYSEY